MPQLSTFNFQLSTHCPGARLYHSTASVWLSVDPLSDKYPSVSSYVYCAGNPVRLVDPDGRTVVIPDEEDKKFINQLIDPSSKNYSKNFHNVYKELDEQADHTYTFQSWSYDVNRDGFEEGKYENHGDGTSTIHFSKEDSPMVQDKNTGASQFRNLFEETYHAFQDKNGRLINSCLNEAEAWKFSAKAPGTTHSYLNGNYNQKTLMGWLNDASLGEVASVFKFGWQEGTASYIRFDESNPIRKGIYSNFQYGINCLFFDGKGGLKKISF